MTADGFAGSLGSGEEEYTARMGVDRFAPGDDREAQDVEALIEKVLYRSVEGIDPDRRVHVRAKRVAIEVMSLLAARERAAAKKARADERERIAVAMSETVADRVTWGDGTEYIASAEAARIARSQP